MNSYGRKHVNGQEDLCWKLFEQQRRQLLAYVRRLAPSCDGVDIVQEVGLRLLGQTDSAVSPGNLAAWCRGVARHVVLHELRAARYEDAKRAALGPVCHSDAWEPQRMAADRATVLRELERMGDISRELLVRRYVLEQTSQEIARHTKMSAAAVRMRLMRIREEFNLQSDDDEPENPPASQVRRKQIRQQ